MRQRPSRMTRVQRLAVIIHHPPAVPKAVLPAFNQGFIDVALVHFGIADQVHHPALGPAFTSHGQRHSLARERKRESGRRRGPPRAGREVDIIHILGAGGIALGALVAAEVLELVAGLIADQVLDSVKDRGGMRLYRHAILRPERRKIERGHDRAERCGRGLMAADLDLVAWAQMVRMVDHPGGKPGHAAFDLMQVVLLRGHRALPVSMFDDALRRRASDGQANSKIVAFNRACNDIATAKCMLSSVESGLVDLRWMLPLGYWSWGRKSCNGRELCDGIVGRWCRYR